MKEALESQCIAFVGVRCVSSGKMTEIIRHIKENLSQDEINSILILDAETSEPVEIDFRGTTEEVLAKIQSSSGTSSPVSNETENHFKQTKVGAVAHDVNLLPRHLDWLNQQPGGASVALRKLVEEARHANENKDRFRQAQESANRFLLTMAGNLPGYEEATRALYSGDQNRFQHQIKTWPDDIRNHAKSLANVAFLNNK